MFGLVKGKNFSFVFCLIVPLSDTPYRRQLLKSYPKALCFERLNSKTSKQSFIVGLLVNKQKLVEKIQNS